MDREKLDKIILKNGTNDWWQPVLFEKNTRNLLPNELEILNAPPKESKNYNCFIYAFGLADNQDFITKANGFIYDTLVRKIIEEKRLIKTKQPENGDYVVYQDLKNYPNLLTHIGVLDNDKIISKWAWGPLVKHNLWDVPKDFGDTVFYLKRISTDEFVRLYEDYKDFNTKPHLD